jgi:hypothetical protein
MIRITLVVANDLRRAEPAVCLNNRTTTASIPRAAPVVVSPVVHILVVADFNPLLATIQDLTRSVAWVADHVYWGRFEGRAGFRDEAEMVTAGQWRC